MSCSSFLYTKFALKKSIKQKKYRTSVFSQINQDDGHNMAPILNISQGVVTF